MGDRSECDRLGVRVGPTTTTTTTSTTLTTTPPTTTLIYIYIYIYISDSPSLLTLLGVGDQSECDRLGVMRGSSALNGENGLVQLETACAG